MIKLEDVLKDLDRRLRAIEFQLGKAQPASQERPTYPRSSPPAAQSLTLPAPGPARFKPGPEAQTSPGFDSSTMLASIGIIFVVLAGIFFIKLSIDSGWLTPMRQILIAAGTGLALFLAPQFLPKVEREYGALLAGAGTTILHLTWLGAYSYHHILDANSALICATLVGIFSIFANFADGNRAYVLVAMAGTYLSAPIVGYNTGELPVLGIFLIIWNISYSAVALMHERRDILFIASYYAVFTVLLLSGKASGAAQHSELLVLQLVQFLIFSSALVSYSIYHNDALDSEESLAVLPLLLLFYFSTGRLITEIQPDFAPWFGLAVGAFVLGIYFFAKRLLADELKSGPVLTAFSAMTFVHSFYFQLLDESIQPMAALLIGLVVMLIWSQSEAARKQFFWPLMILLSTLFYGAILTIVSTKTGDFLYVYNWAYGAVALAAVILLSSTRKADVETAHYLPLLLAFGHLEVMLGFYRFSSKISMPGTLFVTITWGFYAILILALAYNRKDKILGNSALTILLAVSLKAFFYDVINASSLIRIVCLFAQGLLLYGCGWVFKRMQEWKT